MAQRLYQPVSGDLVLWADPETFIQADLEGELSVIEELIALSDAARTSLAGPGGLEAYDASLDIIRSRLKDILDFFDYPTRIADFDVADGDWFIPVAIEDKCGEESGQEAVNAIDGNTTTFWQHNTDEEHQITFQLRDYSKRASKVRLYRGTNPRSALTNLTIQMANSIGGLSSPSNEAVTGASISVDDAWNEIEFTTEQIGKFVRLTGFDSLNANNQVRIREIEVWVETQQYY